jgi:2-keto-4-pentenoate hydratase/2-oxohepta-3-ene-1,7-dioic acid hydratase in catechol pathway
VILLARALFGDVACFGEVADGRFWVIVGDVFGEYARHGQSFPLEDVVLGPPLDGVRLVNVMGGFNPVDGPPLDLPPMWLPKACNFVSGDGGQIHVPAVLTGPVQIESELAVVVGRQLRKASADEATAAIFGWTVFNDVTAPEYGEMGYWAVAKSIDGFASWGPWIRRDLTESRVLEGLAITSKINGTPSQSGNTKYYRFSPSEMLSHVSHRITLFPGDVVTLGTPFPPPVVVVGDHVECEVEEVGVLNNYVVADTIEAPPVP